MKRALWVLITVGLLAFGWYLFVRPFEFEVNFKISTLPGDVIETIRLWDRSQNGSEIIKVDSTNSMMQKITWNDRTYNYHWLFSSINDSTTQVKIEISEPANSFSNKLLIPFTARPIEVDAKEISTILYDILKSHLEITNVKLLGMAELPPSFCACITKETSQVGKANGMMNEFGYVTSFIENSNLIADGPPQVRILTWNHNLGMITYDFCFPIVKQDSLPMIREITYKSFDKRKALKAIYNGNYITSDRAWYYLINSAAKQGYEISGQPVEYFYNNPNLGMNEEEWKAEIFLPIKEK